MAENIPMLALSPTMEEGLIVRWAKAEGDTVAQGEVLCEVETDKATMEYESPVDGILLKILTPQGQNAAIGETIAVIGEESEQVEAVQKPEQVKKPEEIKQPQPVTAKPADTRKAVQEQAAVRSTPLARKLAKQYGLDLAEIKGTGPGGRIIQADIQRAAKQGPVITGAVAGPTDEVVEATAKRKIIADTLSRSKFSSPHYYLKVNVFAENLLQARKDLNDGSEQKISLNSFLIKLVARTLERHAIINSTWQDEKIIKHSRIDIALAVSQSDGLIAPVVRSCQSKDIAQIDKELKALIEKTRQGTLTSPDYANSTFTITNLGSLGIDEFTAIINPPNSAILAVGKIAKKLVVDDEDKLQVRQCMTLTLSCDHRLIDGAVGGAFLMDLKDTIESPT